MSKATVSFEWDEQKNDANIQKHGVDFSLAQQAFLDPDRVIAEDLQHSEKEVRFFCIGAIDGEILTVRFTWRESRIRIFGAGYWRKGKQIYEEKNS
jgi:uncharacterized DUF497 family protein